MITVRRLVCIVIVALLFPEIGAAQVRTPNVSNSSVLATGSKRSRALRDRFADVINVKDFGAKGDGVTNDTGAIQAAIDAAAGRGAAVSIPAGNYVVTNVSATEVLRVTGAVTITGAGAQSSMLLIPSYVPTTADVIHYAATTASGFKHLRLSDLGIIPVSGTPARYAVNIDTTIGPIADMVIERLYVEQLGSGSLTNTNPVRTDGWFTSSIRDSFFVGGIAMNRAGDSVRILNNTITGNGIGIDWDAVVGTNVGLIAGNNITSKDSAIRLRSAYRTVIRDNNIEPWSGGGYSGNPCINVTGSVSDVYETRIIGNTILASLVTGTTAISFDRALNPWVGPNTIYAAGVGVGVSTTVNTVGLKVDRTASAWTVGPTQVNDGSGQAVEPIYSPISIMSLGAGPVRIGGTTGTYSGALVLKGAGGITETIYGSSNTVRPRLSFFQEGIDSFDIAAGNGIWFYQGGATLVGGFDTAGVHADAGLFKRTIIPLGTDRGDTSQTLTVGTDAQIQLWATTLTANRTVTLATIGAVNGDAFRVVRTGLGAFTLDVGGLKVIPSATAGFVDVAYNGTAWVLTGYGAL